MKIILESEFERRIWEIMMEAHRKWAKNHGNLLREQMEWYFDDLFHNEVKKFIEKEARRRVNEDWENVLNLKTTLEEYLEEYSEDGVSREELVKEYKRLRGKIIEDFEVYKEIVELEMRSIYHAFFFTPEKLIEIRS